MAERKPSQTATRKSGDRPSDDPEVLRKAAEEQRKQQAEALRKYPLPMDAEPAFAFRP